MKNREVEQNTGCGRYATMILQQQQQQQTFKVCNNAANMAIVVDLMSRKASSLDMRSTIQYQQTNLKTLRETLLQLQ